MCEDVRVLTAICMASVPPPATAAPRAINRACGHGTARRTPPRRTGTRARQSADCAHPAPCACLCGGPADTTAHSRMEVYLAARSSTPLLAQPARPAAAAITHAHRRVASVSALIKQVRPPRLHLCEVSIKPIKKACIAGAREWKGSSVHECSRSVLLYCIATAKACAIRTTTVNDLVPDLLRTCGISNTKLCRPCRGHVSEGGEGARGRGAARARERVEPRLEHEACPPLGAPAGGH